jgi:hypothetical protein
MVESDFEVQALKFLQRNVFFMDRSNSGILKLCFFCCLIISKAQKFKCYLFLKVTIEKSENTPEKQVADLF